MNIVLALKKMERLGLVAHEHPCGFVLLPANGAKRTKEIAAEKPPGRRRATAQTPSRQSLRRIPGLLRV